MNYRNDKVSDALEVLAIMRSGVSVYSGAHSYRTADCGCETLCQERTSGGQKFKDEISAERTVADALARRLKLKSIYAFDALAGQRLTSDSAALKDLLTSHSKDQSQRTLVRDFFRSPTPP